MKTKAFNMIGACLMILLLVMQFVPFWQYGEPANSVSIQGYVWFPTDYKDLDKELQEQTNDPQFGVSNIVLMPVLELLLCCIGAVCCFVKSEHALPLLFPIIAGMIGIFGYLKPAFRLGSLWPMHITLCVVLLAIGMIGFIMAQRAKK